jgi:hypothetical protein
MRILERIVTMPTQQIDIHKALSYFELTAKDVPSLAPNQPYEILVKNLRQFKYRIKKAYRVVAMKNHPDHGGSLERMQTINSLYNMFMKLQVIAPRPQFVRVYAYSGNYGSTTSSATNTW